MSARDIVLLVALCIGLAGIFYSQWMLSTHHRKDDDE